MKRITGLILALTLILMMFAQPAYSADSNEAKADFLNAIGILKGTSYGYELDRTMNRLEAAVMIVRLRGAESYAISMDYPHPFGDVPDWADPYVGYMYQYALTSGKSSTEYGAYDTVTLSQYVTFLLRALGYDDSQGDFVWSNSVNTAKALGIDVNDDDIFDRGAMVEWTFAALGTNVKGLQVSLQDQLSGNDAIPDNINIAENFYWYDSYSISSKPSTYSQLTNSIRKMAYEMIGSHTFDITNVSNINLDDISANIVEAMTELPMYSSLVKGYEMSRYGNKLTVTLTYNITRAQHEQAVEEARRIIRTHITSDMTDYEKEKVIHDYIVQNVVYDESAVLEPHVYTMYGALVRGSAVCHGYAESFRYLAYLAGLDVDLVIGDAVQNGTTVGHAWNIIRLDGEAYHVDTTWDDPIGNTSERISYAYFNVTDEMLEKDHLWNQNDYQQCNATYYNYFVYEGMEVDSVQELKGFLQQGFDNGEPLMVVRVGGETLTMSALRDVLLSCTIPFDIVYKVDGSNIVTVTKDT